MSSLRPLFQTYRLQPQGKTTASSVLRFHLDGSRPRATYVLAYVIRSAPIAFTTLANGNVTFDLPLPLANAIAANGKQATCEPDTDDRRRGLSAAEACLLSDVQAVAVVVNDRPELASSLLLLPSSCPTLAVGWIETVVLDFFAWARQKSYFPSATAVGLLHIGTVLTWAVYSIYKSNVYTGSQIVHQVIPAGDTASSPPNDISASATSSSVSSASCPSVTLSATILVRLISNLSLKFPTDSSPSANKLQASKVPRRRI